MDIRILDDAPAVAREATRFLVEAGGRAIAARGRFSLALSGGSTPWQMLELLEAGDLPWEQVDIFQVDERVAPAGSDERNLTHLESSLVARVPVPPAQVNAMPVESGGTWSARRATTRRASPRAPASPRPSTWCISAWAPTATPASLVPG